MWKINEELTGAHPFQSPPEAWPLSNRGMSFWVYEKRDEPQNQTELRIKNKKFDNYYNYDKSTYSTRGMIYFLGNPAIWWASALSIPIFIGIFLIISLRTKRKYDDREKKSVQTFEFAALRYCFAWFLHFIPFFLMKRQV